MSMLKTEQKERIVRRKVRITTVANEYEQTPKANKTWFGKRRDPVVLLAGLFLLLLIFVAIFADIIAPYRPEFYPRVRGAAWQDPSSAHWLGTDNLGRDILSRLMHGARASIVLAIGVTVLQLSVGITFGVISGYFGGWIDFLIMRVTDLLYAFPGLLLIILIVSMLGGGIFTAFVVLALVSWADICRLTRAQVLSIKEREFVLSSHAMGAKPGHIIIKHLFPNFIRPIAALIPLGMGLVILSEASLSFLGLGVQPPGASWGNMINDLAVRFKTAPWMVLAPSLSLVITVLCLNYVSDWLLEE